MQKKILNEISIKSRDIFLSIPDAGLLGSKVNIKKIIETKRWLEKQKYPLFKLLAIVLYKTVNNGIFNEVYKKEMLRHGFNIVEEFNLELYSDDIMLELINYNSPVNPYNLVNDVVKLDGEITNLIRKRKYEKEEYESGLIITNLYTKNNYNEIIKKTKEVEKYIMLLSFFKKSRGDF